MEEEKFGAGVGGGERAEGSGKFILDVGVHCKTVKMLGEMKRESD